jgi:ribose transport system permease protein
MTTPAPSLAPLAAPRGPAARLAAALLRHAPLVLFLTVILVFSVLSPAFRTWATARNILVQSSSVAIVATGMTFVLLTAGIDLSVGAIMFVAAAVAGRLVLGGWAPGLAPIPAWGAVLLIVPLGLAFGAVNAFLIAGLRLMPFVVTLATLFIGRGLALHVTETRALNLPPSFVAIGQSALLGVPFPVLLLVLVLAAGQGVLSLTPFGRQIYAFGNNPDAARKAGLPTTGLLAGVYLISGFCAALAGIVSVAQLGAVSPTFGSQREFAAVAAAVLGGTSLFGGRGTVLPGALLGALLVQSVETGLNMINADPYSYPVVVGGIILLAVLVDRFRQAGAARA